MKAVLALTCLAVLSACGADGPPERPERPPVKPEAQVGVTISPDGITTRVSTGIRIGPVGISIGS